jgi:serine/threonine protein kinase
MTVGLRTTGGGRPITDRTSRGELAVIVADWVSENYPHATEEQVIRAICVGVERGRPFLSGSRSIMPIQGDLIDGRFTLERKLGAGGFGMTFVASVPQHDGRRVLKFVAEHDDPTRALEDSLRREIQMTRGLRHPGVVRCFDLAADQYCGLFVVMEFIEGETLDSTDNTADVAVRCTEVDAIALQLAETLDAVHHDRIVHRDVQPKNVIIVRAGGQLTPFLIDFGLAGTLQAQRHGLPLDYGRRGRHPVYGAPEAQYGGGVTNRADQWSLAATLLSAYVGHARYTKLWHKHATLRSNFPNLMSGQSAVVRTLGERRSRALSKATALDPGARFSSCSEFANALVE